MSPCTVTHLGPNSTIVHNETTFGPEKCVARIQSDITRTHSWTFQSIKCVICNLKCSAKTLYTTPESWHFQKFLMLWTNKRFLVEFGQGRQFSMKRALFARKPQISSSCVSHLPSQMYLHIIDLILIFIPFVKTFEGKLLSIGFKDFTILL